jgi:hypothetical protein
MSNPDCPITQLSSQASERNANSYCCARAVASAAGKRIQDMLTLNFGERLREPFRFHS